MRLARFLVFQCFMSIGIALHRPFFLFGHMMNSRREVDSALASGANAIEADIQFGLTGRPLQVYHGVPCDCFRDCFQSEQIPIYLSYIRKFGIPDHSQYNPRMALLYLDLKLDGVLPAYYYIAGHRFGEMLLAHFFEGSTSSLIRVIIGLQNTKQRSFIIGFLRAFLPHHYILLGYIGYDVSSKESFSNIHHMFAQLRLVNHVWQGDGITNCLPYSDLRLREIIWQRDLNNYHMNKVYAWTIDSKVNMRSILRMNIDGIMTNEIVTLANILQEPEFARKYRLATTEDIPWVRITGYGPFRYGCEQDTCWKDCYINGDWCWTRITGCENDAQKCNHTLDCSGGCGKRIHYLHAIGKALFHSLQSKV